MNNKLSMKEIKKLPDDALVLLGSQLLKAKDIKNAKSYKMPSNSSWNNPSDPLKDLGQFIDMYI